MGVPSLTSVEMRFLCSPVPWRLFSYGLGVDGVTIGAMALVLESARVANRGRLLAALASTDRVCTDVLRAKLLELDAAFQRRCGFSLFTSENRSTNTLTTQFGSRIILLAHNKRQRLSNYTFAAAWVHGFDEDPQPHTEIQALADLIQGGTSRIWFTERPQGSVGVHGLFRDRLAAAGPVARRYAAFRAPSWTSPKVTAEDLLLWRQTMSPLEWDLQVCVNLAAGDRKVFPEFSKARHGTDWHPPGGGDRCPWVMGVDWGTTHAHVICAWVRTMEDNSTQMVVFGETHLMECTDDDVIRACSRFIAEVGYFPRMAYLDGAPNAKDANRAFLREFGTRVKVKYMRVADKLIWPGIKVMRAALCPPPGKHPRLLIHDRLHDTERWTHGIVAALQDSNRSQGRDGVTIDKVAENNRLEHALDSCRYICVGVLGKHAGEIYSVSAV